MIETIFELSNSDFLAKSISEQLKIPMGKYETRQFPDSETYLRVIDDVNQKNIGISCTLDHPDFKLIPLYF